MAIKVFKGGPEFKSLKREIDVVRSLPHHENIVALYTVEEEVMTVQMLLESDPSLELGTPKCLEYLLYVCMYP